jgi:hypothetical protein
MKDHADSRADQQGDDRCGNALHETRQQQQQRERAQSKSQCGGIQRASLFDQQFDAGQEFAGHGACLQTEEVFDLRRGDEDRNSIGEADDDHARDEADGRTETGEAHEEENDAGHQRDHGEAAHAEARHDAGNDDNEGAGGATDLCARTAERGDQKASDNGRIQTGLRRDAGGDSKSHCQGQCDEANCDSCEQIVQEHRRRVASERQDRLWQVRIAE